MRTNPGLTDDQWAIIGPLLPPHTERQIQARIIDDRTTCAALTALLLKELPWRAVSAAYGVSANTLRLRWWEWCHADVWTRLAATVEDRRHHGITAGPADAWATKVAVAAIARWQKHQGLHRKEAAASYDAEPPIPPAASVVDYQAVRDAMNELPGDTF